MNSRLHTRRTAILLAALAVAGFALAGNATAGSRGDDAWLGVSLQDIDRPGSNRWYLARKYSNGLRCSQTVAPPRWKANSLPLSGCTRQMCSAQCPICSSASRSDTAPR